MINILIDVLGSVVITLIPFAILEYKINDLCNIIATKEEHLCLDCRDSIEGDTQD